MQISVMQDVTAWGPDTTSKVELAAAARHSGICTHCQGAYVASITLLEIVYAHDCFQTVGAGSGM